MWDEITYPLPNFNGCTVEVWELISNFTPHFAVHAGLKLIYVSKRDPWYAPTGLGHYDRCRCPGAKQAIKIHRTVSIMAIDEPYYATSISRHGHDDIPKISDADSAENFVQMTLPNWLPFDWNMDTFIMGFVELCPHVCINDDMYLTSFSQVNSLHVVWQPWQEAFSMYSILPL